MSNGRFVMEKGAVIAEKKIDVSDVALPDEELKRIFIGGVGAGVTATDLEQTFSPLGRVHAVEFVRANGRNLAFMDFEPSSVRSLAKLLSTYNGCTWKGGKLKLEIAKEHYLARLKREWEEDAKLASAPPPTKENLEFVRSRCSSQENTQIRIFFPNLGKVKPLPFKGSGKHKYSFQRIEVPPLPIHFCDCEEHSKSLETTSQNYLSPLSIVVNEKEKNMMSNVINKLMEGETDERPLDRKTQIASDPKILSLCNEDIHSNETKVSDTDDDDNLVINIGVGVEDDILMQLKTGMAQVMRQESGQSSKGRLVQNKADSVRRKKSEVTNASSINPNKRARPVSADELSKPEPALTSISSAAEPVSSCTFIPAETLNTERQNSVQPAEGQSWLQKSSWKDLVGSRRSSSFSISNVLSEIPKANAQISPGINANAPIRSSGALEKDCKESSSSVHGKPSEGQSSGVQEQRKERPEFNFGEVCPFMRNAESELQWSKAKAALSAYMKRNSNEGSAAKFSKGKASSRR